MQIFGFFCFQSPN